MNPTLIVVVVVLAVAAAVGIYVFIRSRPIPEEPVVSFACPHCKRKLRFRLRQAGHKGACPRCHKDFLFPAAPTAKRS